MTTIDPPHILNPARGSECILCQSERATSGDFTVIEVETRPASRLPPRGVRRS
jgi:hypothetical protein